MSEIKLEQKTLPSHNFMYAGFFIRLLAYAIDMIVISSLNDIVHNFIKDQNIFRGLSSYGIVFWIISLLYFTLMTYFTNGQTLGKIITNIKVISLDEQRLSLSQVVSRETFGRYVQGKLLFLYLIVAFAPKKQSLMDMLCDTVVVKLNAYDYLANENL